MSEPIYCYKAGQGWIPVAQDSHTYYKDVNGKTWRLEERIPHPNHLEPWTGIGKHETLAERLQQWTATSTVPGEYYSLWRATGDRLCYARYFAFVEV